MTEQEQEATESAVAIQSGRDTTINQGLSPNDMRQIIEALSAQMPAYAAVAGEIVDARLKDFEDRVLERFADGKSARSDAFKEPDFQYLLGKAQHAYARSGDEGIRDTLIDLIAQRSRQTERNRLTLSLNEAVEKSAVLTKNEFAELSLAYIFKYTINDGISNVESFTNYLNIHAAPFIVDISEEISSYTYLEAQSCANISTVSNDLHRIIIEQYGGIFTKGFDRSTLESHLPEGKNDALDNKNIIIPCVNDSHKLQLRALNRKAFDKRAISTDLNANELDNLWNMFLNTMWSEAEIIENMNSNSPYIGELFRLWKDTQLKNLTLTSVGIAIAHSNLVRITGFEADLSIWIK